MLLALNRATAVCSPMKHKQVARETKSEIQFIIQIWRSSWANIVFVLQIGLGFYGAGCLINQEFYWKLQSGG